MGVMSLLCYQCSWNSNQNFSNCMCSRNAVCVHALNFLDFFGIFYFLKDLKLTATLGSFVDIKITVAYTRVFLTGEEC